MVPIPHYGVHALEELVYFGLAEDHWQSVGHAGAWQRSFRPGRFQGDVVEKLRRRYVGEAVSCDGSLNVGLVVCGNNLNQCFKEPRATPVGSLY